MIYIDDSGQKEVRRQHMGELVSVGGVIVPEPAVAGFAIALDGIRAEYEPEILKYLYERILCICASGTTSVSSSLINQAVAARTR
ncbi:hypothetical protein ABZU32_38890 [Sphaerisporangium sp. NPDC005288]|uniref:hypothetical protein n=1 Tax=Sphaerisporangium sp. NPDC005288 TaxID=3155114 RepID=UPI0033BA94A3